MNKRIELNHTGNSKKKKKRKVDPELENCALLPRSEYQTFQYSRTVLSIYPLYESMIGICVLQLTTDIKKKIRKEPSEGVRPEGSTTISPTFHLKSHKFNLIYWEEFPSPISTMDKLPNELPELYNHLISLITNYQPDYVVTAMSGNGNRSVPRVTAVYSVLSLLPSSYSIFSRGLKFSLNPKKKESFTIEDPERAIVNFISDRQFKHRTDSFKPVLERKLRKVPLSTLEAFLLGRLSLSEYIKSSKYCLDIPKPTYADLIDIVKRGQSQ